MNALSVQSLPPLTTSALLPRATDRAFLVGQTGSGKTTLARFLLAHQQYVVVYDAKGTLAWPGYRMVRKARELGRLDPKGTNRIIYRPTPEELRDPRVVDGFFRWVMARKHTTVYVDEVFAVLEPFQGLTPPGYHACVTRGREVGVEVWSSAQRPFRIPIGLLSESEHFYVFRLQDRDSRKRMEEVTGLDEESIALLPKRAFYYVPAGGMPAGPLTLAL